MKQDIFSLDNEQPTWCPKCGLRTAFEDCHDTELGFYQLHQCSSCMYKFIGVFERAP